MECCAPTAEDKAAVETESQVFRGTTEEEIPGSAARAASASPISALVDSRVEEALGKLLPVALQRQVEDAVNVRRRMNR